MSGRRCTDAELVTWEQARVIAERLPGLLEARGWKVARLAREAGVLPETARRAVLARNRPTLEVTGKIAAALGMTLGELAGPGPDGELTARQRLAREVCRLRRERGWSQTTLGQQAGLSQSAVRRAEAGDPSVSEPTLAAIAGALGMSLADLTGGAP